MTDKTPKKTKPVPRPETAIARLMRHFGDNALETLSTVERTFPVTVQPDLEATIETVLPGATFAGITAGRGYETLTFSTLVNERREPPVISAAEYLDIDIGEEKAARCVVNGLWLFKIEGAPVALLISQVGRMDPTPGVRAQVIASERAGGRDEAQAILAAIAKALSAKSVYRGKALSFETRRSYMGGLGALRVHKLPALTLDDIILPKPTLETLDRTVFQFVETRDKLKSKGFSTKRGLLLYGPPGTGKTHFIRYVLSHMKEHTSLLVTAEQVAYFEEIMGIARALQPAVVVIEDADLLARSREDRGDCSELLLNSLLNHMDGLTDDAEIMFILTTNRPETLEAAVRDRPGRIDQAVEIPLPDAACRARLLDLYKADMSLEPGVTEECVRRSEGSSAAFMREIARRMGQFAIMRGSDSISIVDMHAALGDMVSDGSFTQKALGAESISET
ncbi:AAA family ATPase [Yoonia sp. BS5-3]|uniref:AAA family ATPase n=1 Tax=Yoonia phaeophyticola TaxID=3137369 RepID=A0ABZ2UZ52_9RHOB